MTTTNMTAVPRSGGRRPTPARLVAVLSGAVLAIAGAAMALIGATVLTQAGGGQVDLGQAEVRSDGHTLVSEPLDWSAETYLGTAIEQVRFDVQSDRAGQILVGLAPPERVHAHPIGEATVQDAGFRFDYTEYSGAAAPLGGTDIWSAYDQGEGEASLAFDAAEHSGEQVLVISSLNDTPLEATAVDSSGQVPGAGVVSGLLLAVGLVGLGAGLALIVVPIRRARRTSGGHERAISQT